MSKAVATKAGGVVEVTTEPEKRAAEVAGLRLLSYDRDGCVVGGGGAPAISIRQVPLTKRLQVCAEMQVQVIIA